LCSDEAGVIHGAALPVYGNSRNTNWGLGILAQYRRARMQAGI